MKTSIVFAVLVLASSVGASSRSVAVPDGGVDAASATSSCDDNCAGKKHGEKMVVLHRKAWEAAIAELSIAGDEEKKILDLAKKIEERMKKAHAAASNTELGKIKVDATRELKKILQDRFQRWQDAEHLARERIITAETGVRPEIR
jgi:hypothetical protein